MRTDETAHVLDGAEHGNVRVAKEIEKPSGVEVRDVLRPDDRDGTVERYDTQQLLLRRRCLQMSGGAFLHWFQLRGVCSSEGW
jgi:hypothetical protein